MSAEKLRRHSWRQLVGSVMPLAKEAFRHVLRRPVIGVAVLAQTTDQRILLVRRGDTMEWALPGGTLDWGESLRRCAARELDEEAGVELLQPGALLGIYSEYRRDPRFHAVTVLVGATIGEPHKEARNALEIREVRLFAKSELPTHLSHGMTDMLRDGLAGGVHWE